MLTCAALVATLCSAQIPNKAPAEPIEFPDLSGLFHVTAIEGGIGIGDQFLSVVGIELATGLVKWRRVIDALDSFEIGEGVVIISNHTGLVALDAQDGHELWKRTGPLLGARTRIASGVLYFLDAENGLSAMNLKTQALLWTTPATGMWITSGEGLVVVTGPSGGGVHDAKTGKLAWAAPGGWPALIANAQVFTLGSGAIEAHDAKTGEIRWTAPPADQRFMGFDAVGGGLLVTRTETTLQAFDVATGKRVWKRSNWSRASGIIGDTLFIGEARKLVAVDLKTGVERWTKKGLYQPPRTFKDGMVTSKDFHLALFLKPGVKAPQPRPPRCSIEVVSHENLQVAATRLAALGFAPESMGESKKARTQSEVFFAPECAADANAVARALSLPDGALIPRDWKSTFGITVGLAAN